MSHNADQLAYRQSVCLQPVRPHSFTRRAFVKASAAMVAGAAVTPALYANAGFAFSQAAELSLRGRVFKTLKIRMTEKVKGAEGEKPTLTERFVAAKEAGFAGIELDLPGNDIAEVKKASEASGLFVDGSVCSSHWSIRHTDANPEKRAKALEDLKTAIRGTHAVGGSSVLLVAGGGSDGTEQEIWDRAVENISKAIPLAAELGIHILIENVWNKFLYDHQGNHEQTAEKYVRFVDAFNSPWIGMQFDIGNHWKYGSMGDWIRQLGKRIVKLDLKGYSRERQNWAEIGEGDINWADVRAALLEINFHGWAAAEVEGGSSERLKKISAQMDDVLKLA